MGTGIDPSQNVIQQIAAAEGVEPVELEPPLYEIIDPDALDALIQSVATAGTAGAGSKYEHESSFATVEFTYRGYRVRVDGTGAVTISPEQLTESGPNSTEDVQSD